MPIENLASNVPPEIGDQPQGRFTALAAWTPGQIATLACLLEASAPKPGNVHRGADFEDLTFIDLATSAVAIGASIDRTQSAASVGATVLAAVRAMREACNTNAYLGTILLIAPLAHAPRGEPLASGVKKVLDQLTPADSNDVYRAINLAFAGGLSKTAEHDVAGPAPPDLLTAMHAAADRDLVARQYANGFQQVLEEIAPLIAETRAAGHSLTTAIIHAHVTTMSRYPDSLIARKCGMQTASQSAALANDVIIAGPPNSEPYVDALSSLDFWLRSDHHRRNPGTTADLIAAAIFALAFEKKLPAPWS